MLLRFSQDILKAPGVCAGKGISILSVVMELLLMFPALVVKESCRALLPLGPQGCVLIQMQTARELVSDHRNIASGVVTGVLLFLLLLGGWDH